MSKLKQTEKETDLDFKSLEFEEVLEGLLEISPTENQELTGKKKPERKAPVKSKKPPKPK